MSLAVRPGSEAIPWFGRIPTHRLPSMLSETAAGGSRRASVRLTGAGAASALRTDKHASVRSRLCARVRQTEARRRHSRAFSYRRQSGPSPLSSPARPVQRRRAGNAPVGHAGAGTGSGLDSDCAMWMLRVAAPRRRLTRSPGSSSGGGPRDGAPARSLVVPNRNEKCRRVGTRIAWAP